MRRTLGAAFGAALLLVAAPACTLLFPSHPREDLEDGGAVGRDDGAAPDAPPAPGRAYRDAVLADGPSLYLRFGERGGPTAVDQMGRYDGTYASGGVTYGVPGAIAGDPDTAVALDGTAGVTMPPGLDFAGAAPFSVELWAKQTAYLESGFAVDHASYTAGRNGWSVRFGGDSFGIERWRDDATAGSTKLSPTPLPLGAYHHVVTTFDGGALRLYLDGALHGGASLASTQLKSMGMSWMIGTQNCQCTGQAFVGSLDEVAVYDRPLGPERIAEHFTLGQRK